MPIEPGRVHGEEHSLLPRSLGYRMPAEWEHHEATWLAWPYNRETWPTQLSEVQEIWIRMIQELSPYEKVRLLVNDEETEKEVQKRVEGKQVRKENLFLHKIVTDDAWVRDSGPVFLTKKEGGKAELTLVDWIFNCWGNKYEPWVHDNAIPQKIASLLKIPRFEPGIVFEGGSIDVNGLGTGLTTESCLLNRNRNPKWNKPRIEQFLKHYLGLDHVIWLRGGLEGDDTDGHIDNLARFVNPTTVACALEEDKDDVNYPPLQDNYVRLMRATDQHGRKLNIVTLPMPGRVEDPIGRRLPASYLNFYVANQVVLVPTYGHSNDRLVLDLLGELFHGRKIVAIDCRAIVPGLGAIHCVTCQQPG